MRHMKDDGNVTLLMGWLNEWPKVKWVRESGNVTLSMGWLNE